LFLLLCGSLIIAGTNNPDLMCEFEFITNATDRMTMKSATVDAWYIGELCSYYNLNHHRSILVANAITNVTCYSSTQSKRATASTMGVVASVYLLFGFMVIPLCVDLSVSVLLVLVEVLFYLIAPSQFIPSLNSRCYFTMERDIALGVMIPLILLHLVGTFFLVRKGSQTYPHLFRQMRALGLFSSFCVSCIPPSVFLILFEAIVYMSDYNVSPTDIFDTTGMNLLHRLLFYLIPIFILLVQAVVRLEFITVDDIPSYSSVWSILAAPFRAKISLFNGRVIEKQNQLQELELSLSKPKHENHEK